MLEDRTAGDPMRVDVLHTELTPNEIRRAPAEKQFDISPDAIRSLLER